MGLIAGRKAGPFTDFAAFVTPGQPTIPLTIPDGTALESCALNDTGTGVLGGADHSGNFYAVLVTSDPSSTPIKGFSGQGIFNAVAIQKDNKGVLSGSTSTHAYAVYFDNTTGTEIPDLPEGYLVSAAINDSGLALVGGADTSSTFSTAFAAFLYPNGSFLSLTGLNLGGIQSVALNNFSQGLTAGYIEDTHSDTFYPYAALVTIKGDVFPINGLPAEGTLDAVSMTSFQSAKLPHHSGFGTNHLTFVNHINQYAPETVFYLVPSLLTGAYPSTIATVSPTRNGVTQYTTGFDTFLSAQSLSKYLHPAISTHSKNNTVAALNPSTNTNRQHRQSLWVDGIGSFGYQRAQDDTNAFNTSTGGLQAGYDTLCLGGLHLGATFSYLFTKVDFKNGVGSANINQEMIVFYTSYQPNNFYIDAAVSGGLFQNQQLRNMQIPSFSFSTTSNPKGTLLIPHLELGCTIPVIECTPFVMYDWANLWQESYSEANTNPFAIQQQSQYGSLLRAEVGARFAQSFRCSQWNCSFIQKGSYVNVTSFNAGQVTGNLIGFPEPFTVETLTAPKNLGALDIGTVFDPQGGLFPILSLFYHGEFGDSYFSNQGYLTANWEF